jgi:hypothetical protein
VCKMGEGGCRQARGQLIGGVEVGGGAEMEKGGGCRSIVSRPAWRRPICCTMPHRAAPSAGVRSRTCRACAIKGGAGK